MEIRGKDFSIGVLFMVFLILLWLSAYIVGTNNSRVIVVKETNNITKQVSVPVQISIDKRIDPSGRISVNGVPLQ